MSVFDMLVWKVKSLIPDLNSKCMLHFCNRPSSVEGFSSLQHYPKPSAPHTWHFGTMVLTLHLHDWVPMLQIYNPCFSTQYCGYTTEHHATEMSNITSQILECCGKNSKPYFKLFSIVVPTPHYVPDSSVSRY